MNCAFTIVATHENLNLLFVAQNGIMLELRRSGATQNHQFAEKRAILQQKR